MGLVGTVVLRDWVMDEVMKIASLVVQVVLNAVAHTKQLIAELRPPTVRLSTCGSVPPQRA